MTKGREMLKRAMRMLDAQAAEAPPEPLLLADVLSLAALIRKAEGPTTDQALKLHQHLRDAVADFHKALVAGEDGPEAKAFAYYQMAPDVQAAIEQAMQARARKAARRGEAPGMTAGERPDTQAIHEGDEEG